MPTSGKPPRCDYPGISLSVTNIECISWIVSLPGNDSRQLAHLLVQPSRLVQKTRVSVVHHQVERRDGLEFPQQRLPRVGRPAIVFNSS